MTTMTLDENLRASTITLAISQRTLACLEAGRMLPVIVCPDCGVEVAIEPATDYGPLRAAIAAHLDAAHGVVRDPLAKL